MRKLLPLLAMIVICVSVSSAVRLNVADSNQLYTQKTAACSTSSVTVGASVASGVILANIPASCIGQSITVRLSGGLLGLTGITAKATITGSTMTIPNATLSALLSTVGALTGVKTEVLINGWAMPAVWAGVTL